MSEAISSGQKMVSLNRKARHLYSIEETYEAGIVLTGTEVKVLRMGQGNMVDSHALPMKNELFLVNLHIPPYEQGNINNTPPTRPRKLLMHRREIDKLSSAVARKGYTLVPLAIYFKNGRAKVQIGLGKGKKLHDKREDLKKRDQEREMNRGVRAARKAE